MSAPQTAERVLALQAEVDRLLRAGIREDIIEEGLSQEGYTLDSLNTAASRVGQLGASKPADVGFGGRALGSALFNFGDEVVAGYRNSRMSALEGVPGGALVSVVPRIIDAAFYGGERTPENATYESELAAARMGLDEYARQNPGKALAADVTGALAPAVVSGGAALAGRGGAQALAQASAQTSMRAAPTMLQSGYQGAKWGAIEGGLSGIGQGEGLQGRAVGGLTGATGGAAIGGSVGAGMQGFMNWMAGKNIPAQAQRYLLNLINEGGASVDDVVAELSKREAIGVGDNIVADVMGPSFRARMTSDARNNPQLRNPLEELLDTRARAQPERLRNALSAATGGQVRDTAQEAANRMVVSRAEADPLYERFRNSAPFVNDPAFGADYFERPGMMGVLNEAQVRLARGSRTPDPSFVTPRTEVRGLDFDEVTRQLVPREEKVYDSLITPRVLQQSIQDLGVAGSAMRSPSANISEMNDAASYLGARQALVARLEELAAAGDQRAKDYIEANRVFAQGKEYEDFAEAGRQFLDADSKTAARLRRERAEASPEGKTAFGEGVLDMLGQRLDRSQNVAGRINSAVNRVADAPAMQRLGEAFPAMRGNPLDPSNPAARFAQQMDALAQQTSTRNQAKGAFQQQATHPLFNKDTAANFTSGEFSSGLNLNPLPAITGALTRGMRQADEAAEQAVRAEAAPFFLAQGSRNIAPMLQDVARTRAIDTAKDAAMLRTPGLASGGAAGAVMQSSSIPEQFGIAEDTAIGPRREDVLRGIEQRERFINDPNTAPEDRALFEQQRDRLRLLL